MHARRANDRLKRLLDPLAGTGAKLCHLHSFESRKPSGRGVPAPTGRRCPRKVPYRKRPKPSFSPCTRLQRSRRREKRRAPKAKIDLVSQQACTILYIGKYRPVAEKAEMLELNEDIPQH